MSYVALARKWRPRTFSEMLGQDHVSNALINSLNQNKLHHAYLFTGTRGVGKTTVARLLSKALNCEQGVSAEPCLMCETCVAIEQGRFIDLIEVDGASRTRVEDTREILENVPYSPTSGRYKIYLIDEIHMLSQHSFNALLKTLEEPPSHVKFLLATTDPQKLPVTVLSRCLQFHLKHLSTEAIGHQLKIILHEENIPYDAPAIDLLAHAARGSMRDALSLLEQTLAGLINDNLSTTDVKNTLGYTQQDYALQLLQALAEPSLQRLIEISRQIGAEGGHFPYVIDELLTYLHQISINQALPQDNPLLYSSSEVSALSARFAPEDVQLFYSIGIKGSEEIHLAPTLAIGFEMMVLRMYTFRPAVHTKTPLLAHQQSITPPPNDAAEECLVQAPQKISHTDIQEPSPQVLSSLPTHIENPAVANETIHWNKILPELKLSGLALNAGENAECVGKLGGKITLRIEKGHQSLFTPTIVGRIQQALTSYYKEEIKLSIQSDEEVVSSPALQRKETQARNHQQAETALRDDPFFQTLQEEFSAELVKNSIVPIKDPL